MIIRRLNPLPLSFLPSLRPVYHDLIYNLASDWDSSIDPQPKAAGGKKGSNIYQALRKRTPWSRHSSGMVCVWVCKDFVPDRLRRAGATYPRIPFPTHCRFRLGDRTHFEKIWKVDVKAQPSGARCCWCPRILSLIWVFTWLAWGSTCSFDLSESWARCVHNSPLRVTCVTAGGAMRFRHRPLFPCWFPLALLCPASCPSLLVLLRSSPAPYKGSCRRLDLLP